MFRKFFLSDWLLAAPVLLVAILSIINFNPGERSESDAITTIPDNKPVALNDSLPNYLYQRAADSIGAAAKKEEMMAKTTGSGLSFFSVGYSAINDAQLRNGGKPLDSNYRYFVQLS